MTDNSDRTFRLGDRVFRRVQGPIRSESMHGDIIGTEVWINGARQDYVFVGWADGKKTWEKSIELRLVAER